MRGSQNYHLLPCHKQPNGVHTAETTGCFGNRLYFISATALHGSIIPALLSIKDFLLRRPHLLCCSWARALAVPDGRKAVCPSHGCCRAKHDTDFMAQDFPPSSGPALSSPHHTLPGSCSVPPVTMKDLFDYSTFALCTAPSYGKTCDSPDPELPPSASSPLPNSPVRTISCQSRQEASSSSALPDLKVHMFSSRRDVITHREHCWGKESKPTPAGVGGETRESPTRGFYCSPQESSHFASASPWGRNYSQR